MSKQQVKKLGARIEAIKAAIVVSKANAKAVSRAKFRRASLAKAARLAKRLEVISAKIAA